MKIALISLALDGGGGFFYFLCNIFEISPYPSPRPRGEREGVRGHVRI